ncbi:HD domain-containing phosphohydrolase [Planctomicrobium sp. SH668]|uniref:HD domain-containing phosphohydrolase n=1 Tax=Planctomicrobium sp. SH668 TaxID=3448126 RepID=UPI003F5CA474
MITGTESAVAYRSALGSQLVSVSSLQSTLDSSINRKLSSTKSSRLLIIDDEPANVRTLKHHLGNAGYSNFSSTSDPSEAILLIRSEEPDLVLLDVAMPEVSGIDILHMVSVDSALKHVPFIVLTENADRDVKQVCLELGVSDFLSKPVDPMDLLPRVRNLLQNKSYHDQQASHAVWLEEQIQKRTSELAASREEVVHCLARAGEFRDDDTGNHVVRVGKYVGVIARELGFSQSRIEILELAAQLHDIGKIGIPDAILHKPGKLDPEQYAVMQSHCAIAKDIIQPLPPQDAKLLRTHPRLGASMLHVPSSPLLMLAARIAQTHHEWWNGTGYPLGLKGEDIPIEGRMTAVADVYDALSTRRAYKDAFPREKCFEILEEGRNTHFDPKILDAFFARADEIVNIQLDFMDR